MFCQPSEVASTLAEKHYLGPTKRGIAWRDEYGVVVVSPPTSRRLPTSWLELTRWCLLRGQKNDGSTQWAGFIRALRTERPDVTTVVSYSDPSVGHTGALYRACNWWWAPTWHRLRPPPTGNGQWVEGKAEAVKDRWVFALNKDAARVELLRAKDASILKRWPWAEYKEPGGACYKNFKEVLATT